MRSRTWSVAALLFGSGFCALVYQTGWLREFRLIFGASTAASAAVLAIFIGGLGAGGLWLGPRADRHPRPLLLYATLEAIVAVSAALSPFLLAGARALYLASGGSPRLGTTAATVVRLVLSTPVLALPTLAMIANAGGGEYLELDREGDREISNKIIDAARRRAGSRGLQLESEELYWRCLAAAAVLMFVGLLFLQERVELWLQAAGAGVTLALVWTLTR